MVHTRTGKVRPLVFFTRHGLLKCLFKGILITISHCSHSMQLQMQTNYFGRSTRYNLHFIRLNCCESPIRICKIEHTLVVRFAIVVLIFLCAFWKSTQLFSRIQSNEFCNYTMKYVNTFNERHTMNFMEGKISYPPPFGIRKLCRGNHCQLAQNKSNTSLVPDNTGFVRVPVPRCVHTCDFIFICCWCCCCFCSFDVSSEKPTKFITRTFIS